MLSLAKNTGRYRIVVGIKMDVSCQADMAHICSGSRHFIRIGACEVAGNDYDSQRHRGRST